MKPSALLTIPALSLFLTGAALGQTVTNGSPSEPQVKPLIATPPSVNNGVANGVLKPSGAPSVSNGVANGSFKRPGAPSVGDGIANGTFKTTTTQQ